ncbi:phosphomevalonate kinase [Acholeplasma equifetale]|uniref:phosphomevalonate kinase n=1 Tax=Acholeplasma equifetale TaxID=264634 RepID=UPI00047D33C4|nr:phosphomevalonate kinase [Acholeplasma equifetale]
MMQLQVPGKLFIIGEYSILKPGNEAILVAVDRFIKVQIQESKVYEFESEYGHFKWMLSDGLPVVMYDTMKHVKAAIHISHTYLKHLNIEPKIYKINLRSELMNEKNQKYGLGSSGAVIVAVIKAILKYHGLELKSLDIFKLSVLAQIEVNDVTSGGELAASIYGGWILYQRYDLIWVLNHKGKIDELMNLEWPLLKIEKLPKPNFDLAVCYSGISKITNEYTDKITEFSSSPWYSNFLNKTHIIVAQFKEAFVRNDYASIKLYTNFYREALLELENEAGIIIESEPFKHMIESANKLGYVAKTSGAGFGDCGFALVHDKENLNQLFETWKNKNLEPLNLKVWSYDE